MALDSEGPEVGGGSWLKRPWERASAENREQDQSRVPEMIKRHRPAPRLKPPAHVAQAVDRQAFNSAWLRAYRDALRAMNDPCRHHTEKSDHQRQSGGPDMV